MLTIAMGLLAVAIGQPAPPLTLERVLPTNAPATWEALRGRPVVLEFWATWCGPCIHEIPHLNGLATKFKDVQFISITDEEPEAVEKFLARHPISGWIGIDRTGTTFRSFGVEARPHTVLVGADGIIRAITLSNRLTELVIADLASGKPLKAERFAAPRTLPEAGPPVFEIMIRPSRTRGALSMGPGNWYAEGMRLRVLLAMAYSVPESRIEGPKDLAGRSI